MDEKWKKEKQLGGYYSSPSGDHIGLFQGALLDLLRSGRILVIVVSQQGLLIDWIWVTKETEDQG